jgi:hypothetical protein
MKTELKNIYNQVKSDFCNLMDYKMRDSTLKIITGVSTLTNHYVSVFISLQSGKYVVSDGGWIDRQYYDNQLDAEDEDIFQRVELQYQSYFDIKKTVHKDGTTYNFKTTDNPELLSMLVHDVSSYISSVVNSQSIAFNEAKEQSQRKTFNKDVNSFLKEYYGSELELNDSLDNYNNDLSNIKFNAIIRKPSSIYLLMYVTGYTSQNFINDACQATVNFQMAKKYTSVNKFRQSAIVNTQANGYTPIKVNQYLNNLEQETNNKLIFYYDEASKREVLQQIPIRLELQA